MANAYSLSFKTLWGNDVLITITPKGATGTPIALTPAAEPFEMELDDSTDIETTIRETTGTLRFVVESVADLEAILPAAKMETAVEVKLTADGKTTRKFAGWIEPTEYSQPWDGVPYEIELPVKGRLAMLEDINVEPNDDTEFATERPFSYFLREAMQCVGYGGSDDLSAIRVIAPTADVLSQPIQREWFLSEETNVVDGENEVTVSGMSWADAISRVLLAYGMTMSIEDDIMVLRFGNHSSVYFEASWADLVNSDDGSVPSTTECEVNTSAGTVEEAFTILSDANTIGWVLPYRNIIIKQKLEETKIFELKDDWFSNWVQNAWGESTADGTTYHYFMWKPWNIYDRYIRELRSDTASFDNGTFTREITIGYASSWDKEEEDSKKTMDTPTGKFILHGVQYAQGTTNYENPSKWHFAVLKSPVALHAGQQGTICFKVSARQLPNGVPPEGDLTSLNGQSGTDPAIVCQMRLETIDGNAYTDIAMGVSFQEDGSLKGVGGVDYWYYKDCDGRDCGGISGFDEDQSLKCTIYLGVSALNTNNSTATDVTIILNSFEVSWCPLQVKGTLIAPGETSYDAPGNFIQVPTENKTTYTASGTEGEDYEISLDTWNNSTAWNTSSGTTSGIASSYKDNRTVQPCTPIWAGWVYGSSGARIESYTPAPQWAATRRKITLDDARAETDTAVWLTDPQDATRKYIPVAYAWKASNEGGKKTLIEILPTS